MTWTTFFFDGNQWFGKVDSPETFRSLVDRYGLEHVLEAKIAPLDEIDQLPPGYHFGAFEVRDGTMPSFGFRREHVGTQTLGEWAASVGLDLRGAAAK